MMSERHYIEGMERSQTVLFPKSIDEYIGEENEVRFIVDEITVTVKWEFSIFFHRLAMI